MSNIEKELFKSDINIEQEEAKELIKQGGIVFVEKEDPESKEKKSFVNIFGIELETKAKAEDIVKIKEKVTMSELDQSIYRTMAECYSSGQPLMLEGLPAAGKSYSIKTFYKLLNGYDEVVPTIYGDAKTDPEEIKGQWLPKTNSLEEIEAWQSYLKTSAGKKDIKELNQHLERKKALPDKQRQEILMNKLNELAKSVGLASGQEWEFKEGPLLRAYSANNGEGTMVAIEEIGVMPTNIQDTFLQICGDRGNINDTIQFWGNGKERYNKGPKTWFVFATNPPEEVEARHLVTTPMASRLTWKRINKKEIKKKVRALIRSEFTAGRERPELKPEIFPIPVKRPLDYRHIPELSRAMSMAAEEFHDSFEEWYSSVGEADREQKFELGARDTSRVLDSTLKYQYRMDDEDEIDLVKTLKRALKIYYIDRLANPDTIEERMLELDELMDGESSLGRTIFDGKSFTEKIIEETKKLEPEFLRTSAVKELELAEVQLAALGVSEAIEVVRKCQGEEEQLEKAKKCQSLTEQAEKFKKKGLAEKDPKKGAELIYSAVDVYKEITELVNEMQQFIEKQKDLTSEIDFDDEFLTVHGKK